MILVKKRFIENLFLLFYFFSHLNFKLKRLRCKDSLKSVFCAHVFKEKKEKERKKYRKLNYPEKRT